jgi:predicted alpha/beta-fold hydrolase
MIKNVEFKSSQDSPLMFDEARLEDLRIQVLHSRERAPWLGGDLQTVAHRITYRDLPIPGIETPMQFPLRDGSGDIMTGTLHDPGKGGPLVILLHGVAGCEDSIYIKESARHLVEQGRRVLRLNHRGAGSSLASCSVTYQCAGTAEIIDVLDTLPDGLTGQGIFLCGFSMGGTILLNMLADLDHDPRIRGAMTVSAPLDLIASSSRMNRRRNLIYQKALLGTLMGLERKLRGSGRLLDENSLPRPRSLLEYDELFTAPRHGFGNAADYYRRASPFPRLRQIKVPVVMLHAENDPWITSDPYHRINESGRSNFRVFLTPYGGHVGFHFRGRPRPFFLDVLTHTLGEIGG